MSSVCGDGSVAPPAPEVVSAPGVPARYRRLHQYLVGLGEVGRVVLSFDEVDQLVDGGLPAAARTRGEWWTNSPHRAYARSWLAAGYVWESVDTERQQVRFARGSPAAPTLEDLRAARTMQRRQAVKRLQSPDWRAARHVAIGWWEPHLVYVIHLVEQDRFKVGVTRVGAQRLADLSRGRETVVVDTVAVANRFLAHVVEVDVLEAVEPWHILGQREHAAAGYTEMWSADGPTVDLPSIAEAAADAFRVERT